MYKILVLDDDKDILEAVRLILDTRGFHVYTIPDWRDLQSSLVSFQPDLILLDIWLNGADGRQICKQLKADKATEHIPVLLFSAGLGIEKTLDGCGCNGFIGKPFNVSDLVERLNNIMDAHS